MSIDTVIYTIVCLALLGLYFLKLYIELHK